ncbi:hypothetical protein I302_102432 [Kwoniella bestiolae CBS 10118]|uniref:Aminoglycoside phosphotransferase domain-containing protein n=1 Tax=Kwoniella bestiolae CBS 10118 TaxID=1296100 RepID=A0A1B9GEZ7_9TREE|nr:hypothetical protein I302_01123 [Kwoniella bestiolae CBS 10118]OCF29614.1 hypothetical protein I302_01123 [Kwoniella bestiolae CBS 10118]
MRLERPLKLSRLNVILIRLRTIQSTLIEQAEFLRPYHTCSIDIPQNPETVLNSGMKGNMNLHVPITFHDGVKWLLRVRQSCPLPPDDYKSALIDSEVATLQWMKRKGCQYTPDAWMIGEMVETGQKNSLHYFFCEYLPGKSADIPSFGKDSITTPGPRTRQFIEEFATSQIALSNIPIPNALIGCLISSTNKDDHTATVGPFLTDGSLHHVDPPYFPGPFVANRERYLAQINIALSHIAEGLLCLAHPLDGYLWHLQLRELVDASPELARRSENGYVKHSDEKGDHLLVDEEGRIVSIVDWESAYVTTKEEAFSSPSFMYEDGTPNPDTRLTPAEEVLAECYENLGRQDLADIVRNGKIYKSLDGIGSFYRGDRSQLDVLEAFDTVDDVLPPSFQPPLKIGSEWRLYLIERYKDDISLRHIIERVGWKEEDRVQRGTDVQRMKDAERIAYWSMSFEERVGERKRLRETWKALKDEKKKKRAEERMEKKSERGGIEGSGIIGEIGRSSS